MNKEQMKAVLLIIKNYLGEQVDAQELKQAQATILGQTEETANPNE